MEGHYLDQQRMQKYYLKEKEISRYKEYLNTSKVKGNAPYIASFRDINLTQKTLLEILSFVLGKLYEVESIKVQTPVFKKTVPSGGSRHPTEAYLAISDVNGYRAWRLPL
ncbi:MAG TPA: hypothetical protein LFV90_05945 [Rickettsia endosymbiont of Columbicola hoogstraali]|nr:hypothetical protein [Rickettsia endosymbiont of Columbicola hoogstraali]